MTNLKKSLLTLTTLTALLLLPSCQQKSPPPNEPSPYTGLYLRATTTTPYSATADFFISTKANDTFAQNEPVRISPPTWDETTTVTFSNLTTGDKIKVDVLQIGDSAPRDMPVYSVELVKDGTPDDIPAEVITYLTSLGYTITD